MSEIRQKTRHYPPENFGKRLINENGTELIYTKKNQLKRSTSESKRTNGDARRWGGENEYISLANRENEIQTSSLWLRERGRHRG